MLSTSFVDLAISEIMDPIALLRAQLIPATAPDLTIDDFEYLKKNLQVLLPYLKHVKVVGRKGVNVLIYGQPGTGKSQLVKVLAKMLNTELFEVACEDEDGDSIAGGKRLNTYRAAQAFLEEREALLVFDEIEDIFPDNSAFYSYGNKDRSSSVSKAWVNRILEENKVPTFWVSNSISCLDPAYTRRFDYIIEIPVPPRRQRERIIKTACKDLVSDDCISRLSDSEELSPAVITRAASVVRSVKGELPDTVVESAIEMMFESTLKAQGHKSLIYNAVSQLPTYYNPDFINAEIDLKGLASRLAKNKNCRICLYGPPGTGKSAYGYWLSKKIDMPIIIKRASDLLSPYVGEAEMNIASVFKQASLDNSILLIDEVDSFLQDRRGAVRSWEVTQVNEFLTQMENYSGIFIASTNLMEGLDQAAMRRFDIKACFDYLKPEQAWQIFRKQCRLHSIPVRGKGLREMLDRLVTLTPGDFAVIARKHQFDPIKNAEHMIERLKDECSVKDQPNTPIGFITECVR